MGQERFDLVKGKRGQGEVSSSYSDARPSEVTEVYWIFAWRKKGEYPKSAHLSGKWLVFVDVKDVDGVWAKVKKVTEEGRLGGCSKVSTLKPSHLAVSPDVMVICVYTYDWTDEEDVLRIRDELRKLGITGKIPYKADEDTLKGRYMIKGQKGISKYYE